MATKSKDKFMTMRLPGPLKNRLKRRAAAAKRTLIGEVVVTLERGLASFDEEEKLSREERARKASA